MSYNPFDPDNYTEHASCLPCCTAAECACALVLPISYPTAPPYPDYATALATVTDSVFGCVVFNDTGFVTGASWDGEELNITELITGIPEPLDQVVDVFFSVSLAAGQTLDIDYAITTDGPTSGGLAVLYDCTASTFLDFDIITSPSGILHLTAPAAGTYIVVVTLDATAATTFSATINVTSTDPFVVNPAVAYWDDSGTVRQLEACPKFFAPPLTEASGSWFATCADAEYANTNQTLDCKAYFDNAVVTGTATGTAPFVIAGSSTAPIFFPWASFNCDAGDVLSFAYTSVPAPVSVSVDIYDYAGTLIETLTGTSPLVSSALPYHGRYIAKMFLVVANPTITSAAWSVSSSGTLEVNPVQALYDSSLPCPSRLNCGDACP